MPIKYDDIKPSPLQTAMKNAKAEVAVVEEKKPSFGVVRVRPMSLEQKEEGYVLPTAKILDLMYNVFEYWARWDNPHWTVISTLWAAHTWFATPEGKLLFSATPRLFPIGEKGSGKTTIARCVSAMSRNSTGIGGGDITAPGVRDALKDGMTVILDEFDREIGAGKANLDLQKLVAAYQSDTVSINGRGGGFNKMSSFGPMMLIAKPRIMTATGGWIEDLFERSFIFTPKKSRDEIPDMDRDFYKATGNISKLMQMWGEAAYAEAVEEADPDDEKLLLWPVHDVPEKLDSRMREISKPLLAVADRAVDPKIVADIGSDLRWAIRGRDAVQNVLLGHGKNGREIIDEVSRIFEELGA